MRAERECAEEIIKRVVIKLGLPFGNPITEYHFAKEIEEIIKEHLPKERRPAMNIIEKLDDLIYQATEERSHYYTAGVLKEAKFNLERERQWCKESEETATRLEASLAESERALGEALGALGKINQKARLYAKGHGEKFNIELLIDIDCYSEAILNEPEPEHTEPGPGAAGGFARD